MEDQFSQKDCYKSERLEWMSFSLQVKKDSGFVSVSLFPSFILFFKFFLKIYFLIFRQRGREGKRKVEKHQCVVASRVCPTGDLAHNPGMCPAWESNQQPSGLQAGAQSTEPHQPGLILFLTSFLKLPYSSECVYHYDKLLIKNLRMPSLL